ncbi:hypothetical protein DRN73_07570, partial [Candidatus Pacearchaeota archaeon]
MKYIFITGGVISSLGKGVITASIGLLLKRRGFKVNIQKIDPYLNVDPGTMNPFQHGEVFVTEDGGETDLDLGHYERFLNQNMTKENNLTAGKIYYTIIQKERKGEYLGQTVQVVPHLVDEIKSFIRKIAKGYDIHIVEIGGTVGDIEGLPFLEAIRQMRLEEGQDNTMFIHLSYVPYVETAGELKTKPTQHSVQKLREIGIQPDAIICRSPKNLTSEAKRKIALYANLPQNAIFEVVDLPTVYEIPLVLRKQKFDEFVIAFLRLFTAKEPDLSDWKNFIEKSKNLKKEVKIAVCGKYVNLVDSYKSIFEALIHAGVKNEVKVKTITIDTEKIEKIEKKEREKFLKDVDGIIIPGGFGKRGIEGKIWVAEYARKHKIPALGICLGMQIMAIEFARNVLKLKEANSEEFNPQTPYPVIIFLPEKRNLKEYGGTLKLGAYEINIEKDT